MGSIFQIMLNIVGGLITVAVIDVGRYLLRKSKQRRLKKIFGKDIFLNEMHLVYGQLSLPDQIRPDGSINTHPFVKPEEETSGVGFSIERPVSSCELRAAKYLAEIFGKEIEKSPLLSSDFEIRQRLDLSFISFGGPASNHKTRDALNNESNTYITFGGNGFVYWQNARPAIVLQSGFDYGLILKIHPRQFQERTWIVCAGLGEWGTSGAAWYLAYKWRNIYKFAKNNQFAIIVRVTPGQDESAEPTISKQ